MSVAHVTGTMTSDPKLVLMRYCPNRMSIQQSSQDPMFTFPSTSPSSKNLPTLILASPLTPVDSLLRNRVAHSFAKPTLTQLTADSAVDAVLELVHGLDAGDFGLLELF